MLRNYSYQPVPADAPAPAVEAAPITPFDTLPINLVIKIAGHLAAAGDWKAVAALFLTQKKFFAVLDDDSRFGNFTMPVTVNQQRYFLPMKNINHILLTNYYVSVGKHQSVLEKEVVAATNARANCELAGCYITCIGCVACHFGMWFMCDWVVIPGLAQLFPGNAFSLCCPGGVLNVCNPVVPDCYLTCYSCCGLNTANQYACARTAAYFTHQAGYNVASTIVDMSYCLLEDKVQNMCLQHIDNKKQKNEHVLPDIKQLAVPDSPDKKLNAEIVGTLFKFNRALCKAKAKRHEPPAVIRMEDDSAVSLVPPRIKMQ